MARKNQVSAFCYQAPGTLEMPGVFAFGRRALLYFSEITGYYHPPLNKLVFAKDLNPKSFFYLIYVVKFFPEEIFNLFKVFSFPFYKF